MRKSKLSLAVMLALGLTMGLAASSWARDFGCGPGAMNLTPEQAGQVFDLKEKFKSDTAPLRKQMMIKRSELNALWNEATPDQGKIQGKQQEINALRDQMQQKVIAFKLEARKIAPNAGFGRGMGPGGGMGRGGGMGPGPGAGSGPGKGM